MSLQHASLKLSGKTFKILLLLTNTCMIETYDDLVTLIGRKLRQRVHDTTWLVEKSNNDGNLMVAFETWLISDKKFNYLFVIIWLLQLSAYK
jgi:hypothetical protein